MWGVRECVWIVWGVGVVSMGSEGVCVCGEGQRCSYYYSKGTQKYTDKT